MSGFVGVGLNNSIKFIQKIHTTVTKAKGAFDKKRNRKVQISTLQKLKKKRVYCDFSHENISLFDLFFFLYEAETRLLIHYQQSKTAGALQPFNEVTPACKDNSFSLPFDRSAEDS